MGGRIDIIGNKYGRFTVLSYAGYNNKNHATLWNCKCECGKERIVAGKYLKNGNTKSCGCMSKGENNPNYKHGHSLNNKFSPEYFSWAGMISRCTNENHSAYSHYGGRGIKVCDDWRNSFSKFLEDMGPRPSKEHSLDRINTDGNYDPSNCRWATRLVQSRNKGIRKNNKSGKTGVFRGGDKWVAQITDNHKKINLGSFDTIDDAIEARVKAERHYWRNTRGEI